MNDKKIIYAATNWKNNSEIILDCVSLGYLTKNKYTLDPTYGKGNWWNLWKPDNFVYHDIKLDGVDFTSLPYDDETFEQICFDPPYVCVGGRKTSGIEMAAMYESYGLLDAPRSPKLVQDLINRGLTELWRVLKPDTLLLVKCQDYNSSGVYIAGTYMTTNHALNLGFIQKDRLEHIGVGRPQPDRPTQKSARRNISTLLIFRKPKWRKKTVTGTVTNSTPNVCPPPHNTPKNS